MYYNRKKLQERIVHLGLGAFHRAHQAFIFNALNNSSEAEHWGICSINLFDDGMNIVNKLKEQDIVYHVIERTANNTKATAIDSIINTMQLQQVGLQAVLQKIAEHQVEIITLTVTEKGYCTTAGGKALDLQNSVIKEDLVHLDNPKSVPAILYKALKLRSTLGRPPITFLSCDNMPENGHALKNALLGFVAEVDPTFKIYLDNNVTFPCSMVDRIVPAVTEESLKIAEEVIGKKDVCAVVTEPFIQWVVEDNFAQKRPNIEKIAGVSVTKDVIPFEDMKLRMLNGSHSFLAYLGSLAGYNYISDCMKDPNYKKATLSLMTKEQAPTLTVEGVNLKNYAQELIIRFENTSLKHQTQQIAMDGSQKITQRWLNSLLFHENNQTPHPILTLSLAGWMYYVKKHSKTLNDPLQKQIHNAIAKCTDSKSIVKALLELDIIFPHQLVNNKHFVNDLVKAYQLIIVNGVQKAVAITVDRI